MQNDEKKARRLAYAKLARRSMHSCRLKKDLEEKGFSHEICENVIKTLENQGFLNDSEYVEYFVQKWVKLGKSRLEIVKKAQVQVIPAQELKKILVDDTQALMSLMQKRYPVLLDKNGDKKLKAKAIRSLLLKGFSFEIINKNRV